MTCEVRLVEIICSKESAQMIWANLIHLSYNMWVDRPAEEAYDLEGYMKIICGSPKLRFDKSLWDDLLPKMAENGVNMLMIDLGDGVQYASHPEIAVEGAWSVDELKAELEKLRKLGIEPIPKLNFSTTHDFWLGPYSRMVSTPKYYEVCADLINECMDIFDNPRLFHLGFDEETYPHQRYQEYIVIRQYDLWWHDLMFFVDKVEKRGGRAWIWSDYIWNHEEEFLKKMPKSILQSNWYYEPSMTPDNPDCQNYVKAYKTLEEHVYDQVPAGSNHSSPDNFGNTVRFLKDRIAPERLKGFSQTVWRPTTEEFRQRHMEAIEQIGAARREFEGKS